MIFSISSQESFNSVCSSAELPWAADIPFSSNHTEICSSPKLNPFPVEPYSRRKKSVISSGVFPCSYFAKILFLLFSNPPPVQRIFATFSSEIVPGKESCIGFSTCATAILPNCSDIRENKSICR